MNYVVISDLHIGGDSNLDIFHAQSQLAAFLKKVGEEPVTLIINGDFIDFLAVEPFGEFSRQAASRKIEQIVKAPTNDILWKGFRDFLNGNTKNRIDILLGNHDVEISFEEVRNELVVRMALSADIDRVQFIVDRVSHQHVKVGQVLIHVEHGFQYDPYNWYDQDELRKATLFEDSKFSFNLPVGSQLVYKALNKLTPDHPYLPLLKPETAAFYILLALAPREVSQHLSLSGGVFTGRFFNKLRMRLRGQQFPIPEPVNVQAGAAAVDPQLTKMFIDQSLDESTLNEIEEFVDVGSGPSGILSKGAEKAKLYLLRKGLEGLKLQRDAFFDVNEADDFSQALDGILDIGAKVAIMGHSHSRKMRNLRSQDGKRELLYVNTGTWADIIDFNLSELKSNDALSQWLAKLEHRQIKPKLSFTSARLLELPGGKGVRVSVEEWGATGSNTIKHHDVLA